jgi:hypothetical protein
VKRSILVAVIAAVVAATVYTIFFRASDESLIRERLAQLAAAIRIDKGEKSPIARAARVRSEFTEIFTADARASIEELDESLDGRDALVSAAAVLEASYQSLDVSFTGVTMRINGDAADAKATAKLTGASADKVATRDEARVNLTLKKISCDWKVVSVSVSPRRGASD